MRRLMLLFVLGCGSSSSSSAPPPDVSADSHDAAVDAGPCGVRSGMRGMTRRTIMAGGLRRTYIVYLPESAPTTPMPLLFVMHGYTMSGQAMFDVTEYPALADTEHVALAFPDGQGGPDTNAAPWNVGGNLCPSFFGAPPTAAGDDFAFMDAIKADIATDQCLDPAHEYMTGFSMGGYFSHHANCMRSDIRAAAPHSGGTHDLASCTEGHKPILILHGASDPLIPDGCDDPAATPVAGVVPSATAWAQHNGCAATSTTTTVQGGTCEAYDGCPSDGQVTICTFAGMGHCWAGGPSSAGVYACPGYAPATRLAWDFFKQHAW